MQINGIELITDLGVNSSQHRIAVFQCPYCINKFQTTISNVRLGRNKSCGCRFVRKPLPQEINGIRIVREAGYTDTPPLRRRLAEFQCPLCDNTFVEIVTNVKLGLKVNCGCYRKPIVRVKRKQNLKNKHPLYNIWKGMINRCSDKNKNNYQYRYYAGRGIKVCEEWANSFESFCRDMGERPSPLHSIDRKDTNGNYTPTNCRWATKQEQSINTSIRKDSSCGHRGITFDRAAMQWRARVKLNGKLYHVGYYNEIDRAVHERNEYIKRNSMPNKN
jgi:hypothetical protein